MWQFKLGCSPLSSLNWAVPPSSLTLEKILIGSSEQILQSTDNFILLFSTLHRMKSKYSLRAAIRPGLIQFCKGSWEGFQLGRWGGTYKRQIELNIWKWAKERWIEDWWGIYSRKAILIKRVICTLLESLITAYFEVLKYQCGCPLLNMEKLDEAGLISVGGDYNHNFFSIKTGQRPGFRGFM